MASLPTAAYRILKLTEDEDSSTEQFRDAVQGDPIFVLAILRHLRNEMDRRLNAMRRQSVTDLEGLRSSEGNVKRIVL